MSIVVRFHPTGMTRKQYDDADRRLRLAEVGIQAGEPEIHEVQNVEKR